MDRRTFVAATAGFTLGVPAVHAENRMDGDDEHNCDETIEVVTRRGGNASNPDKPQETAEWPKPWDDHFDLTEEVWDDVQRGYENRSWFIRTAISFTSASEICGQPESVVKLGVSDVDTAESEVEDERDGVTIVIEETEPARLTGSDDDDGISRVGLLGGVLASLAGAGYLVSRRTE
ncbi:hypothetical protein OB955_18335 [Halobacteria archaeon AArc-m2/3/4]|uniref:PGF-CTERM protein n=1 Tax=Natronoglomus mannanivorans TaxID=2979990 RepID=A0ABT2QIC2_9EURY|nr:hypothetical protein [Halobacteria archaeon AArc-m2/3/4]